MTAEQPVPTKVTLRAARLLMADPRGNAPQKVATHTFPQGGRKWSYKAEMRHFVECVRSGAPFRSPASDTLEDVRTFEAIYRKHVEAITP
jgi:predicted dehydrogenase